jgi:peroxiredoxin (alkyl hydroperoxide reductase subunit C)
VKRLSDYRGKWLMLFSHPADFTPVCTTELMAFARRYGEFQARGVELLGLSVDSVSSHLAWTRDMADMGTPIPYPIIADLGMKVAAKYGMIHPGSGKTSTVRTVFAIDDKGIVRAILYYPATNGRNVEEILRLVDALQYTDKHGVATPANWKVGERVIVPTPLTVDDAEKRMKEDYEKVDWFLAFRKYEK